MARNGKLKALAEQAGVTEEQLVREAIEGAGNTFDAAVKLGVKPNTLHVFLRRRNLRVITETTAKVVADHA